MYNTLFLGKEIESIILERVNHFLYVATGPQLGVLPFDHAYFRDTIELARTTMHSTLS